MSDKKKFGLVMPKKTDTLKTKISSIFNDESDDEEHTKKRPKIPQKKIVQKSSIKTEIDLDPTIYEYDSIYDEMKTKQAESSKPKEAKQSRYIETLLKAADKKKKEYERRIDRKIQIEREKEGDEFKDKEAFVTSSYKKKLQEKEEEEERERRENMLNDMMDVTKQKDLSGFYRHFLNQSIGEEKVPLFGEKEIKKEIESDKESTPKKEDKSLDDAENLDRDSDGIEIDNEDDDSERDFSSNEKSDSKEKKKKTFRKRMAHYRDRKKIDKERSSDDDASERLGSPKPDKTRIRKSSIHSNSDTSSSDDADNEAAKKTLHSDKKKEKDKRNMNKHSSRHDSSSSDDEHSNKSIDLEMQAKEEQQKKEAKEEKQKNIYAKRTVGDVFAEAQARYFQRLAMRNS